MYQCRVLPWLSTYLQHWRGKCETVRTDWEWTMTEFDPFVVVGIITFTMAFLALLTCIILIFCYFLGWEEKYSFSSSKHLLCRHSVLQSDGHRCDLFKYRNDFWWVVCFVKQQLWEDYRPCHQKATEMIWSVWHVAVAGQIDGQVAGNWVRQQRHGEEEGAAPRGTTQPPQPPQPP